jgi:hypothetical protein
MFNALFRSSMADSKAATVKVDDIPAATFAHALEFLYSGEVEVPDEAALQDLLRAASRLQSPGLLDASSQALRERVSAHNCWTLINLSEELALNDLTEELRAGARRLLWKVKEKQLVEMMTQHLALSELQVCAMEHAMIPFMQGDDKTWSYKYLEAGIFDRVVAAMDAHRSQKSVQKAACSVLYYACDGSNRSERRAEHHRVAASNSGACAALVRALLEHEDDTEEFGVLDHGSAALAALCGAPARYGAERNSISLSEACEVRREQFAKLGAPELLVKAMIKHEGGKFFSNACSALCAMCVSSTGSDARWQLVIELGVIAAMWKALRLNAGNEREAETVCWAINELHEAVGHQTEPLQVACAAECLVETLKASVDGYHSHRVVANVCNMISTICHALIADFLQPDNAASITSSFAKIDENVKKEQRHSRDCAHLAVNDCGWRTAYRSTKELAAWLVEQPHETLPSEIRLQWLLRAEKYEQLQVLAQSLKLSEWVSKAVHFRKGSYPCRYLAMEAKAAGVTLEEMKAAGYSALECKEAGFTLAESVRAQHLSPEVHSASEAKAAGVTIEEMKAAGYRPLECKDAGFTLAELVRVKHLSPETHSASEAKAAGLTIEEMKAAKYRPYECKMAGFSFEEATRAGFETWGRERRDFWFSTGKYASGGLEEIGQTFWW